jgi:hypothetical protein
MEFTGVELASDADLAALVEKVAAGPVEKAVAVSTLCGWSASFCMG